MKFITLSISNLLFIFLFLQLYTSKFIDIKNLSSGKYLIVFDDKIKIYDSNFKEKKSFKYEGGNTNQNQNNNIIITKHIYSENIYIFCLIKNYIYLYDDKNEKFYSKKINDLIDYEYLNYEYFNIIPYNTSDNKMGLVLSTIKKNKYERNFGYYYRYYYYYFDYNIKILFYKI